MIINKIKNKTSSMYEVTFDNVVLDIYDETIIKYRLVINKSIDNKLFEEIKKYNNAMFYFFVLKNKIGKKLMSKREVTTYLKNKLLSEEDISIVLNKLESINLINDDLYVNAFINDKLLLTKSGSSKIKKELIDKGISIDLVDMKLSQINEEIWINRASKIINKKINSNKKDSAKMLTIKIKNYLYNEGYENYLYLVSVPYDEEILISEYRKLIMRNEKRGIKKTSQEIFSILISKGFMYEDIKKLECDF